MLEGEIRGLYQCIRVESGEIGQISVDIHKIQRSAKSLSSNAQPSGIKLTFKNGGNHNKKVLDLAEEIWNYLLSKRIMLSTEYTPNQSNW